ncbi:MAG: hypothetical protein K0S20_253 [Patescibacteria group bacterium]|jgi:hypothetical protein|nr:hypothetical protein [Patescibacteria group bacterium]
MRYGESSGSPLKSPLLWIVIGALLIGAVVFYFLRGMIASRAQQAKESAVSAVYVPAPTPTPTTPPTSVPMPVYSPPTESQYRQPETSIVSRSGNLPSSGPAADIGIPLVATLFGAPSAYYYALRRKVKKAYDDLAIIP